MAGGIVRAQVREMEQGHVCLVPSLSFLFRQLSSPWDFCHCVLFLPDLSRKLIVKYNNSSFFLCFYFLGVFVLYLLDILD